MNFENHEGMNDESKNIFHQKKRDCGTVLENGAKELWGRVSATNYYPYHVPISYTVSNNQRTPPPDYWKDIGYNTNTIAQYKGKISYLLDKKIPVRVGAVHNPVPGNPLTKAWPYFQPNLTGGHFLLIVGRNKAKTKFLYIDPYHNWSRMFHTGWSQYKFSTQINQAKSICDVAEVVFDKSTKICEFLGILSFQEKEITKTAKNEIEKEKGKIIIKNGKYYCPVLKKDTIYTGGTKRRMEIIAGPLYEDGILKSLNTGK